jgi:adenosylcobyric acid synthase
MVGGRIEDPAGVDGAGEGLGLLPVATAFRAEKDARRVAARFGELAEPWSALSGLAVEGYEIRHGTTAGEGEAIAGGLGFVRGSVLGVYLHGLLELPDVLEALVGGRPRRTLDEAFDELADVVEERLDVEALLA